MDNSHGRWSGELVKRLEHQLQIRQFVRCRPRPALALLMVLLISAGCTWNGSHPGPPPRTAPPVDRSDIGILDRKVAQAMFHIQELPLTAARATDHVFRVGRRLQHACNAKLPTDDKNVTDDSRAWSSAGDLPMIDQFVVAYERPIAAQAVDEARQALTCQEYTVLDAKIEAHGLFELDQVPSIGRTFAFCEAVGAKPNYLCTVIIGSGDIACSVRATAAQLDSARILIQRLVPLVVNKCLDVPTPT